MLGEMNSIYSYQPLWDSWLVDDLIGTGSFGKVYRISHKEFGHTYTSAVKMISIPSEDQFRKAETEFGPDKGTMRNYFQEMVHNLVNEVNILYSLSGNSNILGYHDHKIIEHKDKLGWDILIRMEYVKPLSQYLAENQMTRGDIVTLGIHLCTALDICSRQGIIHRDIKDENIYINEDGIFKLGDFGIAMKLSRSGWTADMQGTPHYMAPEVYRGENYDAAVDIYSLGIVMYRLLNHERLPHLPAYPTILQPGDDDKALVKRMNGESFGKPDLAGNALSKIIMKACAYQAGKRYISPCSMKNDLRKAMSGLSDTARGERVTLLGSGSPDDTHFHESVFALSNPMEDKTFVGIPGADADHE